MYCKRCDSTEHWTLYCDKGEKDEKRLGDSVRDGQGEHSNDGREVNNLGSGEVRRRKGRDTDGRGGSDVTRFARWKAENRERYNEYMKGYMSKRRAKHDKAI